MIWTRFDIFKDDETEKAVDRSDLDVKDPEAVELFNFDLESRWVAKVTAAKLKKKDPSGVGKSGKK